MTDMSKKENTSQNKNGCSKPHKVKFRGIWMTVIDMNRLPNDEFRQSMINKFCSIEDIRFGNEDLSKMRT